MVRGTCALLMLALLLPPGCGGGGFTSTGDGPSAGDADAGAWLDGGMCSGCTTTDCDNDSLSNTEEQVLGTDPCKADTDGDGIPDGVEAKAPKICVAVPESDTPRPIVTCQTDADCPKGKCVGFDPKNKDQDNDGVIDGEEDRNRDGFVGDCRYLCPKGDECGEGQTCTAGKCDPPIDPKCVGTETDPRLTDTDGDGTPDSKEGPNLVCNTAALINPTLDLSKPGDWTLALDPAFGAVRAVTIAGAKPEEAAATFDDPTTEVAGFVLTKAGVSDPLKQDEADELSMSQATGLSISGVFNRQPFTTYDSFSAAVSQRLVTASSATGPGAVRDALLMAVSGHPATDLTVTPGPSYAASTTSFALLITTVARTDRVVLVAAVAPAASFNDSTKLTSIRMRDLTNGTALARTGKGLKAECDDFDVESLPVADIVWLIDTSGSMSDDQALIASTATEFFTKLTGATIDYRVGVMRAGCNATSVSLNGGAYTTDQAKFSSYVQSPTGPTGCENETPVTAGKNLYEQVLAKNPQVTQPGDMAMGLRPGAKLIYVFVTDEEERNLQSGDTDSRNLQQADIEALPAFQSLLTFYKDKGIISFGMIALAPDCTTKAEPSWGAKAMVEKTGGASWPVCKTDKAVLTAALNALISAAQGASSTFKLSRVPISSTLKLALEGTVVPRSASDGFDYDGPNNAIIFNTTPGSTYAPKVGDEIFVSYRFFEDAPVVE